MIIMGIDPGTSGGISIVETKQDKLPQIIFCIKMPIISMYGKKIVDSKTIYDSIKSFEVDLSIIEKVHAMPRQGVTSSFQFGRSFGSLETLAYLLSKRVDYVAPVVWKKYLGVGSSKKDSLDMARLKFGVNKIWDKKTNDGIAEASLLILYWISKFQN
ncbi:MAG: hypothetical protein VX089_01905 [Pseudomonadota bacterium]|nr:hypothetical protein [Pseudomonadota bacterium]